MSTETDELTEVNRKHRQRILLLKNRAQKVMSRPSSSKQTPTSHTPTSIPSKNQNSGSSSRPAPVLDILKQYESSKTNKTSDMNISSQNRDNSFDYNSTLFRNLKEDSIQHNQKHEEEFNESKNNSNFFGSESLMQKIDKLLNQKKDLGISAVYDQYIQKKNLKNQDIMSGSSISVSNQSFQIQQNRYKNISDQKEKEKSAPKKLKTIQEQNQKIKQSKQKTTKIKSLHQPPKPNKLVSTSHISAQNTIERQKKKLQQTMKIAKQNQYQQKDSIVLQFSDDESQEQKPIISKKSQGKKLPEQNQIDEKKLKKINLQNEKQILLKQLQIVERDLEIIQLNDKQDDNDFHF